MSEHSVKIDKPVPTILKASKDPALTKIPELVRPDRPKTTDSTWPEMVDTPAFSEPEIPEKPENTRPEASDMPILPNQRSSLLKPHLPTVALQKAGRMVANETLKEIILQEEYIVVEKDIKEENGLIETTLEIWMDEDKTVHVADKQGLQRPRSQPLSQTSKPNLRRPCRRPCHESRICRDGAVRLTG